jgi:hypothetical protein
MAFDVKWLTPTARLEALLKNASRGVFVLRWIKT